MSNDPIKVTKEEVQKKIKEGAQVVNVLDPEYYNLGFIQGSFKIPVSELRNHFSELDKNKEVITYCAGEGCPASLEGGKILAENGFNVSVYEGGIKEWKDSGLPVDMGETVKPLRSDQTRENPNVFKEPKEAKM